MNELRGKTIAIDISIYLYKFEQFNSLLENIYVMLALFEHHGIRPCFVFDGKPPLEKQDVLNSRKQERETAYQNYAKLTQQLRELDNIGCNDTVFYAPSIPTSSETSALDADADTDVDLSLEETSDTLIFDMEPEPTALPPAPELDATMTTNTTTNTALDILVKKQSIMADLEKLKKNMVRITKTKVEAVKELLSAYGATYLDADGEADELCASLVVHGKAWACISEDMDLFVYGCPRVLRYFSLVHQSAVLYNLNLILTELKMTHTEFKEVSILAGTDYSVATSSASATTTTPPDTTTIHVELAGTESNTMNPSTAISYQHEEGDVFQRLLTLFGEYKGEQPDNDSIVVRQLPFTFLHWLASTGKYAFSISTAQSVYKLFDLKWNTAHNALDISAISFQTNADKIMSILSPHRFLFYEYAPPTLHTVPEQVSSPAPAFIPVEPSSLSPFAPPFVSPSLSASAATSANKHTNGGGEWTTCGGSGSQKTLSASRHWTPATTGVCQLSSLLNKSKKERSTPAPERYTVKAKPTKYWTPTYNKTLPSKSPW